MQTSPIPSPVAAAGNAGPKSVPMTASVRFHRELRGLPVCDRRRVKSSVKDDIPLVLEDSVIRRDWGTQRTTERIISLPIWAGDIEIKQLFGGLQNRTYFITDTDGKRYVARSGFDQGRIRQTSVVCCTIAAARLGIGPVLRYAEPNLTITDFVHGPQIQLEQQRNPELITRIVGVMKIMHGGSDALPGTVSYWSPFQTVRRYLADLEFGIPAQGVPPSRWAEDAPFWREVTHRLERAIAPFTPVFTHNDMGFANMMFRTPAQDEVWFIDWDGGGFGNPKWDVAEMSMWSTSDEDLDRFIMREYYGKLGRGRMKGLLHEHVALKMMAALRLIAECAQATIDPTYYLSAEEVRQSMDINFTGQQQQLTGLVDLLRPIFDGLWRQHGHQYSL
jgi:thiamine kinase-like enzyme